ncbi:MAG TPA: NAD(P)-dependent oxidoreductase [Planctomycetota bacterium]|jgi:nucleoside-diphosphate-sugar epimerase
MKTAIADVEKLEDLLSEPSEGVIATCGKLTGDVVVLGIGGKMGPTLARMLVRGSQAAGVKRRVIGVSRFGGGDLRQRLESWGIETIAADLLNPEQLQKLPDAPNVVYMAGLKFGSTGQEGLTWAMNTFLPGMVAQKYRRSKIVAFSTGCVYGYAPVTLGGSLETDPVNPFGDYAISCLGRERIFVHFSRTLNIPTALIRLNYSTEMRYGVLVDIARQVANGEAIDLAVGHFNCIWQNDANAMTIRAFEHVSTPPFVLNVTGPETCSVRQVATQFGKLLGREPRFSGAEGAQSYVANGSLGHKLFGYPRVSLQQAMLWTADWVRRGGENINKPTHFATTDGKY